MTDTNDLFERARLQRVARNQRRLLRDEIKERLVVGYNGGLFDADASTIQFIRLLVEEGKVQQPILDKNGYPVMVTNTEEFYQILLGRYTEVVNEIWLDYQVVSESNSINELLEAEVKGNTGE